MSNFALIEAGEVEGVRELVARNPEAIRAAGPPLAGFGAAAFGVVHELGDPHAHSG